MWLLSVEFGEGNWSMSRHTHICLGVGAAWLLAIGLLWMPDVAFASSGSGCAPLHQIASGENLTTLATRYDVSVDVLVAENGIKDPNLITIGQWICIPADKGQSYAYEYWGDYGVPGQSYDPSVVESAGTQPRTSVTGSVVIEPMSRDVYTVQQVAPTYSIQGQDEAAEEPIYIVPGRSYSPEVYERARQYYDRYVEQYASE